MNNLALRAITALIGAGIIVTGMVYGPYTFAAIFLLIAVLTLTEFYALARKSGYQPFGVWGLIFSLSLFGLIFFNYMDQVETMIFWLLPALFAPVFIYPLMKMSSAHAVNCLAISILGVSYITFSFCLAIPIAFLSGQYRYELIVGILFLQWANDTGAYIAGKSFGRTKLLEKVSPKKTWEGAIGGALLALGIAYGFSQYVDLLTVPQWLGLSLVVSVFGTIGDLAESLFKRTLAIKDSGSSIPGHGGFLDRFDGLLLALPFALAYLMLMK